MKESLTIEKVLAKGVEEVLPSKKAFLDLVKKKKIRVYFGIDPTSPDLHLGHLVPLKKLREFQELGHKTILLIGDFTAQIGDPSGRDTKRKPLNEKEIKRNMENYKDQLSKILDLSKTEIVYNSPWLGKMGLKDILELASCFTVPRLLERDMFQERFKKGKEVWVSEMLYPLLQGYDSVALNVDLEIGATDQKFNMLIGRKLQKIYNKKEKFVLTVPILLGLDGRKMSKTYKNTVNFNDPPEEMFGKIMSLKDELIFDYFLLLTDVQEKEVKEMKKKIKGGKLNPRDAKEKLAFKIVSYFWGEDRAKKAREEFIKVFREKEPPVKIPTFFSPKKSYPILELLIYLNLAKSKSEVKRLIKQGGVKIDKTVIKNPKMVVEIKEGMIIQVGKRKFAKLTFYDK
ncbi:MAG: tyrosine--tRNA ligase [Candidatus Pacebacteria bacterium]|nr:tyrosine--tRNA ligase [Candidatus Paceibacterota bacterium]